MGDCATVWQHYLACHQHTGLKSCLLCMKDCATVYKSLASKPWLKVSAAFNNASARLYKEKTHYWTIMGARCLRLSICFPFYLKFHFAISAWRTGELDVCFWNKNICHPSASTHPPTPSILLSKIRVKLWAFILWPSTDNTLYIYQILWKYLHWF